MIDQLDTHYYLTYSARISVFPDSSFFCCCVKKGLKGHDVIKNAEKMKSYRL